MCRNDAEQMGNAKQQGHWVTDSEQTVNDSTKESGTNAPEGPRVAELPSCRDNWDKHAHGSQEQKKKNYLQLIRRRNLPPSGSPFAVSMRTDMLVHQSCVARPPDDSLWVLAAPPLPPV